MRIAHILRKCDPAAWGGTEMAMQRMFDALSKQGVSSVVFCPRVERNGVPDPLVQAGHRVERFKAFVPVLGISRERKEQLMSVGGNILSFDLLRSLWRERDLALIHAHTLGRIGGIGLITAKQRQIPFVVSIHGGVLDLPDHIKRSFNEPSDDGWEWGKLFGLLFQSHKLFVDADAIVTCNEKEASLLRATHPGKLVVVQPHAVPLEPFAEDHRTAAYQAFPSLPGRQVLLGLARVDPVKNQLWLVQQLPEILRKYSRSFLVLAGACTDEPYGRILERTIAELGLSEKVLLTGGLPPNDPRLLGLLQSASVLVLPSISETFGLVILEAWAARIPVIASRTSGASALVDHRNNGWLFDLDSPPTFHRALDEVLSNPAEALESASRGRVKVERCFSPAVVAKQLKSLYQRVIEARQCAT